LIDLEAVDRLPRPQHGLLNGIVSFETGAEHAVAVSGQLPPVEFELVWGERPGINRHGSQSTAVALGEKTPTSDSRSVRCRVFSE
jgi:hypothetical protein